jgi:hypothetical protein
MKKKRSNSFKHTEQDTMYVEFCIKHDIKIYRGANKDGTYYVGITTKKGEVKDPNSYNEEQSWEKFYSHCKYYYEKYKDKV